jgi:O-antigen ligase/tetratricopeptide (TPR) repeat protein
MKEDKITNARGLHCAGLIGVLALLFFHPGAMDMDRFKTNLLLTLLFPLLLVGFGALRFFKTTDTAMPRALFIFALVPLCLLLPFQGTLQPSTESLGFVALLLLYIMLARKVGIAARERLEIVPAWLLAAGGVAGLYALLQVAGVDPFYLYNPYNDAVSTLGNTNEVAEVTALLIPLAFMLLLDSSRHILCLAAGTLPLLVAALWLSGGRAGLLGALCGTALFTVLYLMKVRKGTGTDASEADRPSGRRIWIVAGSPILGLVLGGVLGSERSLSFKKIDSDASIFSAEYPTNKARIEIWKSTLELIADHPFFGVGPGRFRMAYPPYRNPIEAQLPGFMGARTEVRDPHNEFLWAASEGGIPALAAWLIFLLLVLKGCFAVTCHAAAPGQRLFGAAACGVVFGFCVLSLFRAPLHSPAAATIFFLVAGPALGIRLRPRAAPSRPYTRSSVAACLGVVLIACAGFGIGLRGLVSDWLAASAAMKDKLGPEEFQTFQRAADLDQSNIDIINFVGQTAASLMGTRADRDGKYREEAKARLTRVLELHPYHPGALKTLGRIKAEEGDLDEARRLLDRFNEITGGEGDSEEMLRTMLKEASMYEDAAAMLPESLTSDPEALLTKASETFEKGDAQGALVDLYRFLKHEPLHGDALHLLGKCFRELSMEGEDDAFRRMHLAYALDWIDEGDWEGAAGSLKRSLRYGEGAGEAALLKAIVAARSSFLQLEGCKTMP